MTNDEIKPGWVVRDAKRLALCYANESSPSKFRALVMGRDGRFTNLAGLVREEWDPIGPLCDLAAAYERERETRVSPEAKCEFEEQIANGMRKMARDMGFADEPEDDYEQP